MSVLLRKWRSEDAPAIARLADNPKVSANLRDVFPYPYTLQDAVDYAAFCIGADEEKQWIRMIEVDGQPAGSVTLTLGGDVYRRSAELGYWLGEPYWGRGAMTQAVRAACREAFARWDIVRIYAEPFARNAASRRVLEKAGFTLEGVMRAGVCKRGEILDYCMYALLRQDAE